MEKSEEPRRKKRRKSRNKVKTDFKYLAYFFVLIIVLIPIGFQEYIFRVAAGHYPNFVVHVHAFLMIMWCAILLAQPILIQKKKKELHKKLGNVTVFILPLIITAMYVTIGVPISTAIKKAEIAAAIPVIFLPFAHMIVFTAFYLVAIYNQENRDIHLRCIVISSVALLGPTIGRLPLGELSHFAGRFDLLCIDFVLAGFVILDILKKRDFQLFLLGLIIYLTIHIGNEIFPYSTYWKKIVLFLYP